jgi:cytochrome c-type biogenesis protein CcmH/NrfF
VWESSHESLSDAPQSSTQEQSSSKLTELHCAEADANCNNTYPVSSVSNLASDFCDVVAQHYTLDTNQQHILDDSVTKYSDDSHIREFTPSSVPTENYFTDNEGYLRFANETAL